jgi:hypothetical protein
MQWYVIEETAYYLCCQKSVSLSLKKKISTPKNTRKAAFVEWMVRSFGG